MKNYDLAHSALLQILNENVPFNSAIRNVIKKEKLINADRSGVAALVGCSLRHYLTFKKVINEKFGKLDNEVFSWLLIGLSNQLFVKRENVEELNKLIADRTNLEGVKEFLLSYTDTSKLIDESLKKDSNEYLSLRFNTPLWLVNMWNKHFGPHLTYRLLKANSKLGEPIFRINTDEELNKYSFVPSEIDGFVKYIGKGNAHKLEEVADNKLLVVEPGIKFMMDKVDVDPLRGIALFAGCPNNVLGEIYQRFSTHFNGEIMAENKETYFDLSRQIKNYQFDKIFFNECPHSAVITCLSKPVHTFFVIPKNSHFAALRNQPDYFLRFKQEDLDAVIKDEEETLDECAPFVEDGGELVYLVPTISNKECHGIIDKFLRKHDDYSLKEEKQLFVFDRYQTTLYFAILVKGNKND